MKVFDEIRKYEDDFPVWTKEYKNIGFLPHRHREIELIYVRKGILKINISGKNYTVEKGDFLICGSGETHVSPDDNLINTLNFMLIDPALISQTFRSHTFSSILIKRQDLENAGLSESVDTLFYDVSKELSEKNTYYKDIVKSRIRHLWFSIMRAFPDNKEENINNKYSRSLYEIQKVLDFLSEHYTEEIPLTKASGILNLSECHFSRMFKKNMGISYIKYINLLRAEHAVRLLREKNQAIIDIALNSGFNNIRSFNRVFKTLTGCSPTTFLKLDRDFPESTYYFHTFSNKINVEKDSSVIINKECERA